MEDWRQSPVHRLRGANDSAAMHSAQCLMAQAHAQDRQVTALLQKRQAEAWQTAHPGLISHELRVATLW